MFRVFIVSSAENIPLLAEGLYVVPMHPFTYYNDWDLLPGPLGGMRICASYVEVFTSRWTKNNLLWHIYETNIYRCVSNGQVEGLDFFRYSFAEVRMVDGTYFRRRTYRRHEWYPDIFIVHYLFQ